MRLNPDLLPYVVPFVLSFLISAGVAWYAWRHRAVAGAANYALAVLGQALWTFGYIFEVLSEDRAAKIFWDDFQFIGMIIIPVGFLGFALAYTRHRLADTRPVRWLALALSVGWVGIVYTDGWHHLIRLNPALVPGEPFAILDYDFGAGMWTLTAYAYGSVLVGLALLGRQLFRSQHVFRAQIIAIVAGTLIPTLVSGVTLSSVRVYGHRDLTPLTFALENLVVAWALFRFRLFDIVPVARATVLESMNDAVLVFDREGRLVDLNPSAARALGRPAVQLVGLPAPHLLPDPPESAIQALLGLEDTHLEVMIPVADEPRHYDLYFSTLRTRRGTVVGRAVLAHDITPRKQAEAALQERTDQLEAANRDLSAANERLQALTRVKDQFVSNVSHELRTPINNLKLREHLLALEPERMAYHLAVIERETHRLESLVNSLLMLSRLDQRRVELRFGRVDLNSLVEQYVTDRGSLAEDHHLRLDHALLPGLPDVRGDVDLLGQVLSILLTNALNYTPAGGQVTVGTCLCRRADCSWAGFWVTDTGPGIPLEEQGQLFTRFFRGRAGRDSQVPGTGLGLAIAKEIIDRHQGQIELESNGVPGQGATFRVWLPVHCEEAV